MLTELSGGNIINSKVSSKIPISITVTIPLNRTCDKGSPEQARIQIRSVIRTELTDVDRDIIVIRRKISDKVKIIYYGLPITL